MEWSEVIFHCLVLQKMNGMEWSVMEPIPSNTTFLTNFSFPQIGVYPMEWNQLITQLQFCPQKFQFY